MTLMGEIIILLWQVLLSLRLIGAPLLAQIRIDPFWILSRHPWQRALALGEYSIDTMMVELGMWQNVRQKAKTLAI